MKRKLNSKKMACVEACMLTVCLVLVSPDFFYAAGLKNVTLMFANFQEIVTTIISGLGTIVALWCIAEIGGSWMGHGNGGTQLEAFKRMGGAILWIAAPQLVTLFKV